MAPHAWKRGLGGLLMAVALASSGGCLSFVHPIEPPSPVLAEPCRSTPKYCRDHVYIFLVNGLDPLYIGNLTGLQDYLHALGFDKTYYGELYHIWTFKNEVLRICREDPEAHVVLIGFSMGCEGVYSMVRSLGAEGVWIDLLVYIDAKTVKADLRQRPENVQRIVNILSSSTTWNGQPLDGAENIRETDVWHFGTPSHRQTLALLARALAEVASYVPVLEPQTPAMPPADDDEAPTPRPVTLQPASRRDEWDFLKPVSRLRAPKEGEQDPNAKPPRPQLDKIAARD